MSILSFKPFFVHEHRRQRRHETAAQRSVPRGCTTFVEPSGKDRLIKVRTVFCSSKDHFCKRLGREEVLKLQPIEINSRDLPKYLNEQLINVHKEALWDTNLYNHLYKFMV